uniref:MHC class I-like antigen recognition-like domain-containing protein n=1 Tax=Sus scrofa TaxID=9823 RepID=A0A4X1VSZ8_PIG
MRLAPRQPCERESRAGSLQSGVACRILVTMARTAGFKAGPVLLELLLWLCQTLVDSYSLSYNFTINPKAGLGHPWCEVQGQIHGNMFLYYQCGSRKAKLFGPLGMKVNSTKTWERQMETLNYLMEELKKKLLDVKAGIFTKNAPPTLQGRMMCPWKEDGRSGGFWWLSISGQICLLFDAKSGNWTVLRSEGGVLKETLDSDREMTGLLTRIPNGDCKSWLGQVLEIWKRTLEMTAPPSTGPGTPRSPATALTPSSWILGSVLASSVSLRILGQVL